MALSKKFKLVVLNRATDDLDDAVKYYNSLQDDLGLRFYLHYKKALKIIKANPYFRVYYDDIRCLQIYKFPYLIHYTLDEPSKTILIEALICTYKNPDTAYLKKK